MVVLLSLDDLVTIAVAVCVFEDTEDVDRRGDEELVLELEPVLVAVFVDVTVFVVVEEGLISPVAKDVLDIVVVFVEVLDDVVVDV